MVAPHRWSVTAAYSALCSERSMRVSSSSFIALLGSLAVASVTPAQSTLPDSITRRVDAVFARYGSLDAPGCAVGVFQDGRITMARGYGAANIEYAAPLTPATPMIMGSVSKQFTAAAIALLVQDGRISLDDDVRKYLPELPDFGKKITISQLVHHTSGLRDFWALAEAAGMRLDDGYDVHDVLTLAARQHHLNFDPGAEYNYSNTGYVALGEIVHRVTGKTLRQFAAERILRRSACPSVTSTTTTISRSRDARLPTVRLPPGAGRSTSGTTISWGRAGS
jgi:CubicO group peptidase (beta-lactamase class C family)